MLVPLAQNSSPIAAPHSPDSLDRKEMGRRKKRKKNMDEEGENKREREREREGGGGKRYRRT